MATEGGRAEILGFYALNAHSLEGDDLPANLTRNAPRSGGIPTVYLSMIAVDRRRQGQGFGRILLAGALNRAAAAADQIGIKAVVLDVIEDGGPGITEKRRAFYAAMGFSRFRRVRSGCSSASRRFARLASDAVVFAPLGHALAGAS